MAMRWSCWRRGCSWRPTAVGSPRRERPGCVEPLGTRAASDTRAQIPYFSLMKILMSASPTMHSISQFHQRTPAMCSCRQTQSGEKYSDPFKLGWRDLKGLYEDIRKELHISTRELKDMSEYYFDGKGKAFRPIIVVLMARACNIHHNNAREMQASQRSIALVAEMIHTATLVHDDVIDDASSRRGKHTVNKIWASVALARIGNTAVVSMLAQVIEDLVRGEFLQLGSKENENERFAHYLEKTFKKTASLIANSCKAFPEMNAMIMRRFSLPGDVDRARQYVLQSDGVQQTTYLAQQYCHKAVREIRKLRPSTERDALIQLSESVLTRDK